ncbi:hypothetical protein [Priestia koreensis]|uniref:hypothetical protein n=1 Tax=Priestia koreensis TaxID=284581 RepID=UPI0034583C0A
MSYTSYREISKRLLMLQLQQLNQSLPQTEVEELSFGRIGYKTLSTGVLIRKPRGSSAVINAVNVGRVSHDVTVEVWDWSSYSNPKKLPVLIGNNEEASFPYRLRPNNLAVFYSFLLSEGVLFYEVRIIYRKNKNIIVNIDSQSGDQILQHQLVEINP